MNLIQRVQDILLRPAATWPAIEQEPGDVASLYKNYLLILAAIPALAGFIGMTLIGVGGFGMHMRIPFAWGLTNMVVSYVLSLVMVFVLALIVDALAPTFNGSKSQINALKLVAYAMTAAFVGGIFSLIPSLGVLGLLAALYSIYLIYTGLPVLMKCPPDKAAAYTAVVVVCGIVAGVVIGAISAAVTPSRGFGRFGGMHAGRDVTISTPKGEVNIDTTKLDEMAKRMEEAGKRMEAAQKSGDNAAAGKALNEVVGAMVGTSGEALPPQDLKALLPESVSGLRRESIEAQSNQAMGITGSAAKARYVGDAQNVQLSITDLGGIAGLAALAGWANSTLDKETDTEVERVYKQGNRTVREKYRKDGSRGEVTVLLANGVVVEAEGTKLQPAALKSIVEGLDLARLESMKRPAKG